MKEQRNTRSIFLPLAGALSLVACGGDPAPTNNPPARDAAADVSVVVVDAPSSMPSVRLVVDANRNGTLDDTTDEWMHRADWSTSSGAMLMANVDDDDGDHMVDALDNAVNGDADVADLARVRVAAWAQAPEGAEARLAVDMGSANMVGLFKRAGDAWSRFNPASDRLTRDELRAGVEFGIEAKDFPTAQWNGRVELTLTVTAGAMTLTDRAVMHTAPWLMYNSLAPTVRIFGPVAEGDPPADGFTSDLRYYTDADSMPLTLVNTLDPMYHTDDTVGPDVWIQDFMEFGWTGIPGPDGMHSMPVVLRTPTTTRTVALYTQRELLGPDFGYVWKHGSMATNGSAWDQSLDSFGDLELIPPHSHGGHDYPLGRVIHGSIAARHSDLQLNAFLDAQVVQGPVLYVDTSWLHVGHVDEFISFVPADTPRGWKMLYASPRLARTVLQAFADRAPGNNETLMFAGQHWYYASGPMRGRAYPAQRTVGAILADVDLMAYNQQTQAHIDAVREVLQQETGLTDDEIVEFPILFETQENGRGAAYMPGTVNLLLYGHTAIIANPHGPLVVDHDIIADDVTERLRPFGITAQFAEQWDLLHAAEGEVHCGTNALREVPELRWWEVAR